MLPSWWTPHTGQIMPVGKIAQLIHNIHYISTHERARTNTHLCTYSALYLSESLFYFSSLSFFTFIIVFLVNSVRVQLNWLRVLLTSSTQFLSGEYKTTVLSGDTDSVASTVTRYRVDSSGFKPRWWWVFPYPSRPNLRIIQPPLQLISEGKAAGAWC